MSTLDKVALGFELAGAVCGLVALGYSWWVKRQIKIRTELNANKRRA